jgi:redox-sensing transcriptional repressor
MSTSKNVVLRLSKYKNALHRLKRFGFVKIFSSYLADAVGVTSVQVRKDFSLFGVSGNKRGGYQIDLLIEKLNVILGKSEIQKVVLAGAGQMGAALMRYRNFEREGIEIVAAFDTDPAKQHTDGPVPVFPLERIAEVVRNDGARIGIIAVPDMAAQQVCDLMIAAGVMGILNFAPITLRVPEGVVVNNVTLELELENVIYFVNAHQKARQAAG